ncbi:MAG: hypothetical protein Q4F34_02225, partial [Prevotellaceae bacterium]|nr:hypothetical protein [Prevotellaceae bacterium]
MSEVLKNFAGSFAKLFPSINDVLSEALRRMKNLLVTCHASAFDTFLPKSLSMMMVTAPSP